MPMHAGGRSASSYAGRLVAALNADVSTIGTLAGRLTREERALLHRAVSDAARAIETVSDPEERDYLRAVARAREASALMLGIRSPELWRRFAEQTKGAA